MRPVTWNPDPAAGVWQDLAWWQAALAHEKRLRLYYARMRVCVFVCMLRGGYYDFVTEHHANKKSP